MAGRIAGEPIVSVSNAITTIEDAASVYRENQQLKLENQRLLQCLLQPEQDDGNCMDLRQRESAL
jgi:cell shape-determining protein MreC